MKLVIGGSSGFVGKELIRQGLSYPAITSIVALSRRETPVPPEAGAGTKLSSVVCDNFESYPDSIKKELEDADACIWTIAVTPSKLNSVPYDEACKISRDYAITAIQTLSELRPNQKEPLRFIYMSGHLAFRNRDEVPEALKTHGFVEYGLMRGDAESQVLGFAEQSEGTVQSCIAKPGLVDTPGQEKRSMPGVPNVDLPEVAAALLNQVVNGFEKDTLKNDDLIRIGRKALAEQQSA
ncbi:hypothetical protein F4677DRAFT_423143 [Hypoxylon crocopeplum]|nr:hypothetical protein F4677DRAFT_423143 [Hypoxylon crocopeplum]